MAVYTDITEDDLARFLTAYDAGTLTASKGIADGVENSNFLLHTTKGAFILTLYEKRVDPDDLPFFLGLMHHLADRGLSCPLPLARKDGKLLGELSGRPAAMISLGADFTIPASCSRSEKNRIVSSGSKSRQFV